MPSRIVLIDENIQSLIRAELATDGHDVHCANDGMSGIKLVQATKPDLILLNVKLSGMDGIAVFDVLKAEADSRTPIVLFSEKASEQDRVHGLNLGAADYISMPCSGDELRARVGACLRQRALVALEGRRATRDSMTGLRNRAYVEERLAEEVAAALRHHRPLSCVMIDMDRFKTINEAHGFPFGDDALRRIASTIATGCRREDVVARWDGEEFIILCPGVDARGASLLSERLRGQVVGNPLAGPRGAVKVTCSFGVAELGGDVTTVKGLISLANKGLQTAKREGRNRVRIAAYTAAGANAA